MRRTACVVVALALLGLPGAASATVWQVTTQGDGASTCPSAGSCTLRGAVTMANGGGGADVVQVPAGTYSVAGGISVTAGMQIVGTAGAAATTLQPAASSAIFDIAASATDVTLSGLTVRGAHAGAGGAVATSATHLTLTQDVFAQNSATDDGGAVVVNSMAPTTLTIADSTFSQNTAGGNGTATSQSGQGTGGAIGFMSPGTINVARSTFAGNSAGGNGGDGASSGQGGGGAINAFAVSGVLNVAITDSTFSANRAGGNGGVGGSSGQGSGGGISLFANGAGSQLTVTNSTFDGNTAGGTAGAGGSSGQGSGGNIDAFNAVQSSIVNSTVVRGRAGVGSGGNIAPGAAGAMALRNTIVAGGSAIGAANCSAPVVSQGHNIEDANDCGFNAAGDRPTTAPGVGFLAPNGGPTQTVALLPGSPAIDGGDAGGCPATDQRGALRPAGVACDVGAFEVATPGATTGQASGVTSTAATLGGVAFNPDVAAGSASFEFGPTTAYGQSTAGQAVGAGSASAGVSAPVTGLTPNTTYHFRLVVTDGAGTALGADGTFKTLLAAVPSLRRLRMNPSSVLAAPGRGASISGGGRPRRRRTGATVTYSASEAVVTSFTVQRPRRGFRSGRRCVSRRPRRGRARRCTLYRNVGSFTHRARAGSNRFHFTGRARRRPLRVGRYRLRAVPRSSAGRTGRATYTRFRVVG